MMQQFTWRGEENRKFRLQRPCVCGCDERDGYHGVGYLTGSDALGRGVTVWITDEDVYQALARVFPQVETRHS